MSSKRYIVRVDALSLEADKIGDFIERRAESAHSSVDAAKRMLGSHIAGKRARAHRGWHCRFYAVDTWTGREFTWTDLRNIIEFGAP